MEIVFLDAFTLDKNDINFEELTKEGHCSFYEYTSKEEEPSRVGEAEVIIVNKHKVAAELLQYAPKLKLVIVAATGYNNIDVSLLQEKGIILCNVRNYSSSSVVQHVVSSVLYCMNQVHHYHSEVKKGRWSNTRDFCFIDHSIEELAGKRIGIMGFGSIGKKLAEVCKAFEMEIFVFSKYDIVMEYNFVKRVSKEDLFYNSDIISLHLPLNSDTSLIINSETLGLMKKNAILINTGRGGLINETDLYTHLVNNQEFTAIIDVLTTEPPLENQPLIKLKNCIITPHIAWASKQARQRLVNVMSEILKGYKRGEIINQIV